MNAFEKPQHPTGYVVFDYDTKSFRGKYLHLVDIKTFCQAHNIAPCDIVVLRTFGPKDSDFNRKIVPIEEYAFRHVFLEKVGEFNLEREAWEWTPQPEFPQTNTPIYFWEVIKLYTKLLCIKIREIFPYSI